MVATVAMAGLAAMAAQEGSAGIQIATGLGAPRQAVTGATGGVGSLAVALLSSLGWSVLSLLDAPRGYLPPLWGASFAAYVATFAYRCLVSGEDS